MLLLIYHKSFDFDFIIFELSPLFYTSYKQAILTLGFPISGLFLIAFLIEV